jgi:phosphate transport system permease protein
MNLDRPARRKAFSHSMTVLSGLSVVAIMIPLIAVVYEAAVLGGSVFNLAFFTQGIPYPCTPRAGVTCSQGGIAPAIQGTFILVALASLVSVPIGLAAAIFAVEYGGQRRSARIIGVTADVLSGVPSIVVGAFVYAVFVIYYPTIVFSALTGSLALAVIMVPIVARTSEEALRTVPNSVREAALALGISRWKTSVRIVLISALPGIVTGVLLAIARAAGEAAPLLILDNGSFRACASITTQCAAVPILMFTFATTPYQNWINLAWGAALFLLLFILALSLLSRYTLNRLARRMRGE